MPRGRPKKKKVEAAEEALPVEQVPEVDSDVMSDEEADALVEKSVAKKEEVVKKATLSVDSQDWTRQDPVIPEALESSVWIAVYNCPKNHKTKATNRQRESGIYCYECGLKNEKVKADIMPGLFDKAPEPRRKNEKRGSR